MDPKSEYSQIEVDKRDREKTDFVRPDRLHEFKVIPFGCRSASATFRRVMITVLAGLSCLASLDDVVVFSRDFDEHMIRLRTVLQAVKTAELTFKTTKSRFANDELKLFGHVVNNTGVRPHLEKTRGVAALPPLSDRKTVRTKILGSLRLQ